MLALRLRSLRPNGGRLARSLCGLALAALTSLAVAVPAPQVEGPIRSDPPGSPGRNYVFLASDFDLAGNGYVEEEFFYSGSANLYDVTTPDSGAPFPTANIVSSGHPYKTRLLVRRPAKPHKFNGVVIVEWTNVSSSFDNPVWWSRNHEFFMREGYAWVGIAAQRLAVHGQPNGLKNWSPTRYGTLDIPGNVSFDNVFFDGLSFDIYGQGIQAVRSVPAVMGGLPVRRVIAGGHSQSARFLAAYFNAVHQREPVADAGMVILATGQQIRSDLNIPVMKIMSESEYELPGGGPNPRPQAQAQQPDTDRLRSWWMSGTSHSDQHGAINRDAIYGRDLPGVSLAAECPLPRFSRIESEHIVSAATDAVVKWIERGTPPAHSPWPVWTSIYPTSVAARDGYGNALGGIRLATFAVPTATSNGANPGGPGCAQNGGVHIPFDTATLTNLYRSHEAYVRAVKDAAKQNVRDGFLLEEDAAELIDNAQSSIVGTGLNCGPLCANVKQFQLNPSTTLLRDHTAIYYFRGAEHLLAKLDRATRLVAEGYTAAAEAQPAKKKAKFEKAIQSLRHYIKDVERMPHRERAAKVTADLLVRYANTLIQKIGAEAALP